MSVLGKTILVKGELRSTEDLTIEGRIDGPITCVDGAVVVTAEAAVAGDVIARDITVFGRSHGQLIATEVVDVRAGATVTGTAMSKQFILHDGAHFTGRVEPQHLDAALRVARFNQQKRDARA
ncbi:MAG TPA: polymer-forming cytoskeletal protein [Vicinamibacterales bacterium]|nr:polymer-forming cytoskeletal protein [Vicinamibacterales bacterium]